jgi:branched-chain amino acid transport system permease protein
VLLQTLTSGLFLAAIYALAAFGLAIVYGVLDILNFAHGALLVLGAYLAFSFREGGAPLWLAAVLAVAAIALIGLVLQRLLFRRVEKEPVAGLVLSIGLIAIANSVILSAYGPDQYRLPRLLDGSLTIGDTQLPQDRLLIIAVAVTGLGLVELGIARAGWGKLLRATAEDDEAASLQGIPVARVKTIAFTAGAALAAVAGVLIATTTPFDAHLGENLLIKAFVIIIIGGVGSTKGALAGAGILGLAEAFSTTYLSTAIAQLVPLLVLAVVLLARPQGIFGRVTERT